MKNIMILSMVFLTGCASMDADYVLCHDKDSEAKLASTYAFSGGTIEKFENFQKGCKERDYPVPSREKFITKYEASMKHVCSNENEYFRSAYASYKADLTPTDCKDYNENTKKYDLIKADALQASQYKKQLDTTTSKSDRTATAEKLNQITKKYDL